MATTGAPNNEIACQVGIIGNHLGHVLFGHVTFPALQNLCVWIKVHFFIQEMLRIRLMLLSYLFAAHGIPVFRAYANLLDSVGIVVT